jgi:hypothetical protein
MNLYILIAKIVLVAFFLLMFLRSNKLVWGIGLLTVTTAILLDTLLSTFSRDEILTQLGFFFYVIVGGLVAGAALWLWGLMGPRVRDSGSESPADSQAKSVNRFAVTEPSEVKHSSVDTAFDRQMLFDQLHDRLGPDDLLDVIFDLGWVENDVVAFGQDNNQLLVTMIDLAEQRGQTGDLALAVERILTPIPSENLPRLEKLTEDSPPTILRHYLLATCDLAELEELATQLELDWELLGGDNKKSKTRNLLLFLSRRNRIPELIDLLQAQSSD